LHAAPSCSYSRHPFLLIEGFLAVSGPRVELSWRPLSPSDPPAVTDLARSCLAADGGQPYAGDPDVIGSAYFSGAQTHSGWDGARLVCVSALREGEIATTTGLVHPGWRRRGLGGQAFDWAVAAAGNAPLTAETEMLSDGAHALYLNKGLSQVFAEDVMQLAGPMTTPARAAPESLVLSPWGQADPGRFFAVYDAAFRDRPGFPGWPPERWVAWVSGDDDFRPDWTLLAALDGTDVGFIVGDASGWIIQLGVVPAARGKAIGAVLIGEAVRRMRAGGDTTITLNVNVDNPHAIALYRRLGFVRTGRRARYRRV
jgi:mycothiol synthase